MRPLRAANGCPSDWRTRSAKPARSWIILLSLALCIWVPSAGGNPMPVSFTGIHVQEYSEGFCSRLPFADCDELDDLTSLTGTLEFDFYFACPLSGFGIDCIWEDVRWRFYWPEDWSFVSAEACGSGWVAEQSGNEVIFELPTLSGTPANPDECSNGLATIVLEVGSYGTLRSEFLSGTIESSWDGMRGGPDAVAGYPCSGCRRRECGGYPARPVFIPAGLTLEIPASNQVEEIIRVFNGGLDYTNAFEFSTSVPWITITSVEENGGGGMGGLSGHREDQCRNARAGIL